MNRFIKSMTLLLAFVFLFLPLAAQDFEKIEIKTEELAENVYILYGGGGNIGVSIGEDGVILIDSQYAQLSEKIKTAVKALSDRPIRFVINTHMHLDHTGGNEPFADDGALIIAQENVREGMTKEWFHPLLGMKAPPSPEKALPVLTFNDTLVCHLNDEIIHLIHLENAHTDGDTVVYFQKGNVLHTGDLCFSGMYPFIDTTHGGSTKGLIAACDRMLRMIDDDTKVIPGHGPLTNRAGLEEYKDMLISIRERISKMIKEGMTLEQIIEAKPTSDFDQDFQNLMPDLFIKIVHHDLSKEGER